MVETNKYIDPNIKRRNAELFSNLKDKKTFSPAVIELNIIAKCNRTCSFCPVSSEEFYKENNYSGRMEKEFFHMLVNDLKSISYSGKVQFAALSEPLLHKDITYFISYLRDKVKGVNIELVTNGDVLNAPRLAALFEAGLNILNISMYDGDQQIKYFKEMVKEADIPEENVLLRRRYLQNGNYGITFSNKGGLIDLKKFSTIEKLPLEKICYYPFYHMMIDINGDVVPCCHDWGKKGIIGNLYNNSLMEIWNGKKVSLLRKKLSNFDRNIDPCKKCDTLGDLIGKENYKFWKKLQG